jgi:hypothetical protein
VRSELPRAIPAEVLALRRFDTTLVSGQMGGLRRQLDRQPKCVIVLKPVAPTAALRARMRAALGCAFGGPGVRKIRGSSLTSAPVFPLRKVSP